MAMYLFGAVQRYKRMHTGSSRKVPCWSSKPLKQLNIQQAVIVVGKLQWNVAAKQQPLQLAEGGGNSPCFYKSTL